MAYERTKLRTGNYKLFIELPSSKVNSTNCNDFFDFVRRTVDRAQEKISEDVNPVENGDCSIEFDLICYTVGTTSLNKIMKVISSQFPNAEFKL